MQISELYSIPLESKSVGNGQECAIFFINSQKFWCRPMFEKHSLSLYPKKLPWFLTISYMLITSNLYFYQDFSLQNSTIIKHFYRERRWSDLAKVCKFFNSWIMWNMIVQTSKSTALEVMILSFKCWFYNLLAMGPFN